jgi:hypothetical protein
MAGKDSALDSSATLLRPTLSVPSIPLAPASTAFSSSAYTEAFLSKGTAGRGGSP